MYILSLCDVEEVQQILGIVKMIVDFIKIIVRIILMVSAMITLMLDIKAGNEDDARTLIAKKQQYESNLVSYKKTQELTHANADKMRQMHDKLVNDIETLEARRDAIKATVASAKAQEHINKIVSGGDKAKSSMESFERYEKKAEKMLDAATAEAELNTHTSAASTLADKYTSNGSDASVEDELAAMKAKLGL